MDNPRWHRWPFKGWREDTAVSVIGVLVYGTLLALMLWALHGCYLEHVAEPCEDSGVMPMAGTQAVNLLHNRDGGSNPPTPTDDEWCEGPYVGCIAPGSPLSSTWAGR